MKGQTWIESHEKIALKEPIAIVGSPGLRSIGKLTLDRLISETNAKLFATLYSTHLPLIYQTKPSYASDPALPGIGGINVQSGEIDLPKVEFFVCSATPIIMARGCHANFEGQYEVAETVVDLFKDLKVKRVIVVAGYSSKEKRICCAATNQALMDEMKQNFDIRADYHGPFYGFSGLVFGLSKLKNIEAICLFAGTEPVPEDPELPDESPSSMILETLAKLIPIKKQPISEANP